MLVAKLFFYYYFFLIGLKRCVKQPVFILPIPSCGTGEQPTGERKLHGCLVTPVSEQIITPAEL